MDKVSIRFFGDREVRAVWDDENAKWWFSVIDIIGVLRDCDDYERNRNYWKYLKAKLKREGNQLGSVATQFKFAAPDGKNHAANVLDFDWSAISPTIFGAVFESTLNPETRRSGGMHYTSLENIHKVIDPLFLDDLSRKFDEISEIAVEKTKRRRLLAFQDKLASLTFLENKLPYLIQFNAA